MELASANRKISSLNGDIASIHQELDKFAQSFEQKLESAIGERDVTIDTLNISLKTKDEIIDDLNAEIDNYKSKNERATEVVKALAEALTIVKDELSILHEHAVKEKEIKERLISELKTSGNVRLLEDLIEERVTTIALEFDNENDKLKKDNIHLQKEIDALRLETAAEQALGLKEDLTIKPVTMSQNRSTRHLFTQGTLMLDFPKLFES